MYIWTHGETNKLRNDYSHTPWQTLAKILPTKPRYEVRKKANSMGLRKSRVGCGYYWVDENFFEKWSSEMAYITGVIAADGEIYINKTHHSYNLEITSKDFVWLDGIRKVIKAEHPIYKRTHRMQNGNLFLVYRLRMGSKKLVEDLLKIGIHPRKSLNLKFPQVPEQHLNHFVRGYFDGDGNILAHMKRNRYPCIQLSFYGTKDFLTSLNHIIAEGVSCSIKNLYQMENIYRLRYNTHEAENVLCWMYRDALFYLDRKYQIFVQHMHKRNRFVQGLNQL